MSERIAITGMGIVSSIGMSVEANYDALIQQKSGISTIENINTLHKNTIRVGEIKLSNQLLLEQLAIHHNTNYSRTSLIGILALKEALLQAQIIPDKMLDIGFVSASSVGGMDMTERYFYEYQTNSEIRKYIKIHNIGDVTHQIADFFGIKGLVTSVSTACSSSANAIITAANLIRTGRLKRVVAGGTDALTKFTINGFNTLMILSQTECTPFDQNRTGLNLGEAAAFLVLEAESEAIAGGKNILAYLSGWGNANDAYHQTASSQEGEGAFLAMQKALACAKLTPSKIDYVNAHGTATLNNDLSESRALLRVFTEKKMPYFSSTKPFTGHTLAAAASVEAVFSIMALQKQVIFPNLNYTTPMQEVSISPQRQVLYKEVNHVLSNSFGFGGNCSTLIFSKK